MKRVLALLGALGMIGAALLVRGALTGDDGDLPGRSGDGSPDDVVVACPTELEEACRTAFGVDASIAPAASTLDGVLAGEPEAEVWIVSRPWADALLSDSSAPTDEFVTTGARSPVVVAVWTDRRQALTTICDEGFGLRCLGQVAGRSFTELGAPEFRETVHVGVPDPATMAGLDVGAAAASSYFTGPDFASNDFDLDFESWLGDLLQDVGPADPFGQMLTRGTGAFTATVGLEAELRDLHERAANRDAVDLLATGVSSELVVVGLTPDVDPSSLAADDDLLAALAASGWRVPGQDAAPPLPLVDDRVDTDPSADGMAELPGVLAALLTLVQEVTP